MEFCRKMLGTMPRSISPSLREGSLSFLDFFDQVIQFVHNSCTAWLAKFYMEPCWFGKHPEVAGGVQQSAEKGPLQPLVCG